jgi:hypothetical protein
MSPRTFGDCTPALDSLEINSSARAIASFVSWTLQSLSDGEFIGFHRALLHGQDAG